MLEDKGREGSSKEVNSLAEFLLMLVGWNSVRHLRTTVLEMT